MCNCLTEKGTLCTRPGKPEYNGYCFQHKNCEKSLVRKSPVKKIKPKPLPKRPIKSTGIIVKSKSPIKIPILPMDMMKEVYLHLSPEDVVKTCTSSKDKSICNDKFWKLKLKKDFGLMYLKPIGTFEFYVKVAKIYKTLEKKFDNEIKKSGTFKIHISHAVVQPVYVKKLYDDSLKRVTISFYIMVK